MSSNYRLQLEDYLRSLEIKSDRVLDVGGLQFPIKGRTASWEVDQYKILDVIEEMEGRRADFVGDISRTLAYHKQINELENEWDLLFCLEVMEYVIDPVQTIKNLSSFLVTGGELYITFPFIYPNHPPLGTDALRYTQEGAEKLLREGGFKVENCYVRRAGPGRQELRNFWDVEGMRYRKDDLSYLDHIGYIFYAKKR